MLKEKNGITLIALIITIIVLIILAGITFYEGAGIIKEAKTENVLTNMITIKAKAKVYAEEANAKVWDSSNKANDRKSILQSTYNMVSVSSITGGIESELDEEIKSGGYECYSFNSTAFESFGLDPEDAEYFIVVCNSEDYTKMDVIFTLGVTYKNVDYYTLSKLQNAMTK